MLLLRSLHDALRPAPLGPDDVDVWIAEFDSLAGEIGHARALLSDEERARYALVLREVRRQELLLARAALRVVLAAYVHLAPGDLPIDTGPVGKPRLRGVPRRHDRDAPYADETPQFNLAHAGGLAAIAVTLRPAVGIDIEPLGRRIPAGLLERVLAPGELALVLSQPGDARDEAFLRHWTAKEAYAKATGQGLSAGLRSVVVADALGTPSLQGAAAAAFSLRRLDPRPGVVGAVAVAGGPVHLRTAGVYGDT